MRAALPWLLTPCLLATWGCDVTPEVSGARLPVLVLSYSDSVPGGASAEPAGEEEEEEPRAARLALRGIGRARLATLNERLDELATQVESHLSPLGSDLGEQPPEQTIGTLVADHLPTITAARRLAAQQWTFEGGTARLAASCGQLRSTAQRCLAIQPSDDSASASMARFSAWPVTRAVYLRACAEERQLVLASLRALASKRAAAVAMVLTSDDLRREDSAVEREATELVSRIGRVIRRAERADLARLLAWADRPAPADLMPSLSLDADLVMVVPRLGSLARPHAFHSEIRSALSHLQGCVTWLAEPARTP